MATVRITKMLVGQDWEASVSDDVYEVTPETAKAAVAVLEDHKMDIWPVALTKSSVESKSYVNGVINSSGRSIPSHGSEGDEIEIKDYTANESYKVKLTKDFFNLCHYNRPEELSEENAAIINDALKSSQDHKLAKK